MDIVNNTIFARFTCIRACLMFGILAAIATAPCQAMDGLPDQPGQYELELLHDNQKRSYILHIPPQYNGKDRLPLVLAFHGGAGNAKQLLGCCGLAEKADREGFILAVPNGSGILKKRFLTWNVSFGFGYAMKKNIDDVGFVRQLIDELENGLRIDPDRIFATGISNGAILTHLLAAHLPGKIAAIAPIVGAVGGKKDKRGYYLMPPSPASPVAVIVFNGRLDQHMPYKGGIQEKYAGKAPVYVTSARTMRKFWTKANGCADKPERKTHPLKQHMVVSFGEGCRGSEVVQYLIFDQGHAWPGSKNPRRFGDTPSKHVSANDIMWEFFSTHPRKQ